MKSQVELLASYWTISCGLPHTDREYSPFDFRDHLKSAARAGLTGFGIWHVGREHLLRQHTLREMKQFSTTMGSGTLSWNSSPNGFLRASARSDPTHRGRDRAMPPKPSRRIT